MSRTIKLLCAVGLLGATVACSAAQPPQPEPVYIPPVVEPIDTPMSKY